MKAENALYGIIACVRYKNGARLLNDIWHGTKDELIKRFELMRDHSTVAVCEGQNCVLCIQFLHLASALNKRNMSKLSNENWSVYTFFGYA